MDTNEDGSNFCGDLTRMLEESTWITIMERYRRLLIAWASRCPATAESGESPEAIADQALTRAWLSLSSKASGSFPNLAAFLSYLRMCVTHTAIDILRMQAAEIRISQSLAMCETIHPEQHMLERLERAELWHLVSNLVTTERERIVLVERFVLDLPPRIILARHATLFADKQEIYSAVRNLRCRLRRRHELQLLWDERLAA